MLQPEIVDNNEPNYTAKLTDASLFWKALDSGAKRKGNIKLAGCRVSEL